MPRLALINMVLGFAVLFFAAAAGSFIALDISDGYLRDKEIIGSWRLLLQSSAHGHTNLFGLLHIVFGLTIPYSGFSQRVKFWQTIGFILGTLAMSAGMVLRAAQGPADQLDFLEIVMGTFLSCALASLASHAYGLGIKLYRH